jgi:arylsulfatase
VIAVMDLAPTFLELAGATPESLAESGPEHLPVTGRSFAALLRGEAGAGRGPADVLAMEGGGQRAIRRGDWKALRLPPVSGGTGEWQLFNLAEDPGERNDLAAAHPEVLAELAAAWDAYAQENGVLVEE